MVYPCTGKQGRRWFQSPLPTDRKRFATFYHRDPKPLPVFDTILLVHILFSCINKRCGIILSVL